MQTEVLSSELLDPLTQHRDIARGWCSTKHNTNRRRFVVEKRPIAYQQGDVILFEEEIPVDARKMPPEEHQNTLRRGEVTGHAHRVSGFMEAYRKTQGKGDPEFMAAPKRITLRHEEHAGPEGQEVAGQPKGAGYFTSGVREVDHITNELRRVAD